MRTLQCCFRLVATAVLTGFFIGSIGDTSLYATPQPMLLRPGKYVLEKGLASVRIPASCLDITKEIPMSADSFAKASPGINVTRVLNGHRDTLDLENAVKQGWVTTVGEETTDAIAIKPAEEGIKSGARFEIEVDAKAPQFVTQDAEQFATTQNFLANSGSGIREFENYRGAFEDLFKDDAVTMGGFEDLKQSIIWDLRHTEIDSETTRNKILQLLRSKGYPDSINSPGMANRLPLILGRNPSPGDLNALSKIYGQEIGTGGPKFTDCARIDVNSETIRTFYGGETKIFDDLDEACAYLESQKAPAKKIILANASNYSSEMSEVFSKHRFLHVTDVSFFANNGLPQAPDRIIIVASKNAKKYDPLWEGQSGDQVSSGIADLTNAKVEVVVVDTVTTLFDALRKSKDEGKVPWVLCHNNGKEILFFDRNLPLVKDVIPDTVIVSCNLFQTEAENLALRTTVELHFKSVCRAIAEARVGASESNGSGDFLGVFTQRYCALDAKSRLVGTATCGIIIGGVASGAFSYAIASSGKPPGDSNSKTPATNPTATTEPEAK